MAAKRSLLCPSRAAASALAVASPPPTAAVDAARQRSRWLKILLRLHWISSALCLTGLLVFSVSGITLNHASRIEAKPQITLATRQLPAALLPELQKYVENPAATLPPAVDDWLRRSLRVDLADARIESASDEIYVPLPRPGGDAWLRIDLASGAVDYEVTDRGWISWLNDLHKGRHTGDAWSVFIDVFAAACLFFAASGLLLLKLQAGQRPSTWPLVAFGTLLPALIALLFIH